MKRNISKALAILMTLALIMSLAAVSAFAVNGGTRPFEKEFAIPDGANMPNVQFEYSIVPGTAVPVGPNNEIAIYAGPTATVDGVDYPFVTNAVFPSDDNSANNHDNRDGTADTDPNYSGKKIYIDNAIINLTGIEFTAAGVYRYVVTEKAPPQITGVPGVTYENNGERYLDVFVFPGDHDNDSSTPDQLMVTEYSLTKNGSYFTKEYNETQQKWVYTYSDPDDRIKSSGYKNTLDTVDLEFAKTITGNQAEQTEKFTFTLSITGANPNQEYALEITGTNVLIEGTGGSGVTNGKITTDANGAYTGTFSLTAGDKVKVLDLPVGYSYTLSEDAEDYTSTGGTDAGFTNGTVGQDGKISGSAVNTDISTGFNNERTGIIPTGVIITIAPFAIGLLLFGAVMMFMISRRRRATY